MVHIRHQASQNAKTNRPGLKTADTVYILINFKIISRRPPLERRRFPDGRPLAGPNPSFCWQQQPPTRERAIHPSLSESALVLGEGAIDPPLAEGAWVGVLVCVGCGGEGGVECVLMWSRSGGVREERLGPNSKLLPAKPQTFPLSLGMRNWDLRGYEIMLVPKGVRVKGPGRWVAPRTYVPLILLPYSA